MRAVGCKEGRLEVVDLTRPEPAKGQVLIEVLRCGICGSDLHARQHCDELADVMREAGYDGFMRSDQQVVFGHEFCGEVAEYGPALPQGRRPGTPVVAFPLLRRGGGVHADRALAAAPGAYAEQVLVEESLMSPSRTACRPTSPRSPSRWRSAARRAPRRGRASGTSRS